MKNTKFGVHLFIKMGLDRIETIKIEVTILCFFIVHKYITVNNILYLIIFNVYNDNKWIPRT